MPLPSNNVMLSWGGYSYQTEKNEIELIQQFEKLIDQVNINEIGMKEKIKYEVERIKRFN